VRFKALREHLGKFARRYILTGTPTPQSIEDLFSQAYICDEGAALGKFITRFRREFCMPESVHVGGGRVIQKWHPKKDAADRVYARVNGMALRLKAEDHLTMPKLIFNRIEVELPAPARAQYNTLAKDLFLATGGGLTMAPANAAACLMKLRQLVNGTAYAETEERTQATVAIHTAKLDALADLVEEQQGTPLLVAVSFLHEVEAIRARLGDAAIPYLGGGVSAKAADDVVARWNRGELPVLLVHPTSVAHGLNLQAGGHCVAWFGLTWNLEEYDQLNRRVYRQGQTKTVVIHHIVARDTVDGAILDALQAKSSAQQAILNVLKGQA
jgi:SNF2 family DNA or RNA helicase